MCFTVGEAFLTFCYEIVYGFQRGYNIAGASGEVEEEIAYSLPFGAVPDKSVDAYPEGDGVEYEPDRADKGVYDCSEC